MKFLLINDYYRQGGAEAQVDDMFRLLKEHGHEVLTLSFDAAFPTGMIEEGRYNFRTSNNLLRKFRNKFFINPRARSLLKKLIADLRPDVVHLHNDRKMTRTVAHCLKGQKVIQTFHDYGYVCPEGRCDRRDGSECGGFFSEKCRGCRAGKLRLAVKKGELKRSRKFIDRNVRLGLSPSRALRDKMIANGYKCKIVTFPNVATFSADDTIGFTQRKNFLYCGVISREKGIKLLLDSFREMQDRNLPHTLTIVGGVSPDFRDEFETLKKGLSNVNYIGKLPREEVQKLYRTHKCLIVPSLWMENYPNVMLEAFSANLLCIGSDRGGPKEILGGDGELLFSPVSEEQLIAAVERVAAMNEEEYSHRVLSVKKRLTDYHATLYEAYMKEVESIG